MQKVLKEMQSPESFIISVVQAQSDIGASVQLSGDCIHYRRRVNI